MSVTGADIRIAVGRILRATEPDAFLEFVNTATDSDAITDGVNLASSRFTSQEFQDRYVRINSGNRAGNKTYGRVLTNGSGKLTVSPSFSGALANGDKGELWKDIDPDTVDMARCRFLSEKATRLRLTPASWLLDADFLVDALSDATPTHWTAVNATATVTNRSGMERFSERVLRVQNSAANGYAGQTVNNPHGGTDGQQTTWFFSAPAQADSGTAQVVIQDLTNSAALTLNEMPRTTWDGEGFQVIRFTVDLPATCEQVSVRLGGAENTADTYWGPVTFYPLTAREFVLPARLSGVQVVGKWYVMSGDDWPNAVPYELSPQPRVRDVGGAAVRAFLDEPAGARAIFFEEIAHYSVLQTVYNTVAGRSAGDAATTDCELEYAAYGTLEQLFPGRYAREFDEARRKYAARVTPRFERGLAHA